MSIDIDHDALGGLRRVQKQCWGVAEDKGWHEKQDTTIVERIMLVVTELAEAVEELRNGNDTNTVYYNEGSNKPEGFPIEIADAFIRLFDICGIEGIDIATWIAAKQQYNATREHRHGGKVL